MFEGQFLTADAQEALFKKGYEDGRNREFIKSKELAIVLDRMVDDLEQSNLQQYIDSYLVAKDVVDNYFDYSSARTRSIEV